MIYGKKIINCGLFCNEFQGIQIFTYFYFIFRCAGWVLYELCMRKEYDHLKTSDAFDAFNWIAPSLDHYKNYFKKTFEK